MRTDDKKAHWTRQRMDYRNQWVNFKIRDVYFPEPAKLLTELHSNDVLQGKVIDFSINMSSKETFAVVKVEGVEQPIIVPLERIVSIL